MTDAEYAAWLVNPNAVRIVLFEVVANVSGTETTRYLSTGGYVTSATDTPANTDYKDIVLNGINITESISLTSASQLTVGDIEICNESGERDSWLNDIWVNRSFKAYIGDPRWIRSDFRLIFDGITADIDSKSRDRLNIKLRDKLQRLNTPVSENKHGGDCTYSQSGTTVTITKANHGRHVGSPIQVHINTGTAISGTYTITSAPTTSTFTYVAGTSLTTSGTLTIIGVNEDNLVPIALGEVHNISPLLVDPTILSYQCHDGTCESIFEVRDNGKPVTVTVHNDTGKFELIAQPAGTITVSMQGDKPAGTYYNTISQLVQRLVTGYGKVSDRFTSGDLDATNLAAFDTAHPQPVGLYLPDRTNVLDACQQLASSVGAQLVMSRAGLLQLIQIALPAVGTPTPIYQTAQLNHSIEIVNRTEVVAAVKLGYCKNYTLQPNLTTSIPPLHKDLFNMEWLTKTSIDTTVQTNYKLNTEPVEQDTALLVGTDAQTEADRRLALYKVTRTTYKFEGGPVNLLLELGQAVTLYSNRFGLDAGVLGMVISLSPNWITGHVIVEVLV